jgi:hypothetical protein
VTVVCLNLFGSLVHVNVLSLLINQENGFWIILNVIHQNLIASSIRINDHPNLSHYPTTSTLIYNELCRIRKESNEEVNLDILIDQTTYDELIE